MILYRDAREDTDTYVYEKPHSHQRVFDSFIILSSNLFFEEPP